MSYLSLPLTTLLVFFFLGALTSAHVSAEPYTPPEWQGENTDHPDRTLRTQRKHTTWTGDRNRNFIDDEIEQARFRPDERINVVIDLNTSLTEPQIRDLFSSYGRVKYISSLITFILLDGVRVDELPNIAAIREVAMIEWNSPMTGMDGISGRGIASLRSSGFPYSPSTAEDLGFTGKGVNIAIVDTGVDAIHEAFQGKLVRAYDATTDTDLGNTPSNNDSDGHGTHVAGIALGMSPPSAKQKCRRADCPGVAKGAGLVDIKVCTKVSECLNLREGLDWLANNAKKLNVRVVNISLGDCTKDDNGTSAAPQQVNRLVKHHGLVAVIAHGNASSCGLDYRFRFSVSPGSASSAITVQGTSDENSISRGNDTLFFDALIGPRVDVDLATGQPVAGLKPDLSAPGNWIWAAKADPMRHDKYTYKFGTSMATPHVAGAAAVILEARPQIDPDSLKALLKQTADPSQNTTAGSVVPTFTVDPGWVPDFGSGIIDVYCAIHAAMGSPGDCRPQ
jgi:subtilisin family serine protease